MSRSVYDASFQGYRVFVGDLGSRIGKYELQREFEYYGTITDVWVARNPPGFAFLVYKYADEADKAVRELHGRIVGGRRVRVEHARPYEKQSRGRQASPPRFRQRTNRDRSPRRHKRSYSRSRSRSRDRRRRSGSRDRKRQRRYSRSRSRDHKRSKTRSRTPDRRSKEKRRDSKDHRYSTERRSESRHRSTEKEIGHEEEKRNGETAENDEPRDPSLDEDTVLKEIDSLSENGNKVEETEDNPYNADSPKATTDEQVGNTGECDNSIDDPVTAENTEANLETIPEMTKGEEYAVVDQDTETTDQ